MGSISEDKTGVRNSLLLFLDLVSDYIDEGIPVDAVYLDFQKAFDKVPHSKLLTKMPRYGIDDGVVRWVGNWLSGRKAEGGDRGSCIWLGTWELVLTGVLQGSVLGPVLFIVFIDEGIRSTVVKFADDTKLVARVGSKEDRMRLRQDLIELFKWSEDCQIQPRHVRCNVFWV